MRPRPMRMNFWTWGDRLLNLSSHVGEDFTDLDGDR